MEDGGFFTSIFAIITMICVGLPVLALFIWSVIWAYRDAERRGKPGCLVALLVFWLTWPLGLILWLLIRPQDKYL